MNPKAANISTKRVLQVLLAFWLLNALVIVNPPLDWADHWDPKVDRAIYGDLEDGGEEGGDDD